jgi:hypothetical protein
VRFVAKATRAALLALATLGLLAGALVGLILYEAVRYADARDPCVIQTTRETLAE